MGLSSKEGVRHMGNTFRITKKGINNDITYDMDVIDKDNKVVVKKYFNGKFLKSTIVPTSMHPLPKNEYEIFTSENTEVITDPKLLEIIDSVKFKTGKCYSICEILLDRLTRYGFNPVPYEGWVFLAYDTKATHHCVIRVGNSIIDTGVNEPLEETYRKLVKEKGVEEYGEDARKLLADVIEQTKNVKNSEANPLIGKLASSCVFIGCENNPTQARINYNILMDKYPNHEDYTGNGMTRYGNRLNEMLTQRGL